jgi:AcrR family transcriptional regulator
VAEIVREAGLSNQAFYRHFAGKDDLVAAIVDAGARRLRGYLAHRMAGEGQPAGKVRVWVRGVLSQATDEEVAAPTRAIGWNRNILAVEADGAARDAESLVWALLEEPLARCGQGDPEATAYLIGKLVFAVLVEALWSEEPPTRTQLDLVEEFCLAAVTGGEP